MLAQARASRASFKWLIAKHAVTRTAPVRSAGTLHAREAAQALPFSFGGACATSIPRKTRAGAQVAGAAHACSTAARAPRRRGLRKRVMAPNLWIWRRDAQTQARVIVN